MITSITIKGLTQEIKLGFWQRVKAAFCGKIIIDNSDTFLVNNYGKLSVNIESKILCKKQ